MAAIDPQAINDAGYKDDIHLTGVTTRKKVHDVRKSKATLAEEFVKRLEIDAEIESSGETDPQNWLTDVEKNIVECDLAPPTFTGFLNFHNNLEKNTEAVTPELLLHLLTDEPTGSRRTEPDPLWMQQILSKEFRIRGPNQNYFGAATRLLQQVDPKVVPSLHLPAYFELKEFGQNFRYKTDPEWVIDVIHRDCVAEEGLTYISEVGSYSVTFFQLINYCAKRGFNVTSFGKDGNHGTRWAVLHNEEVQQYHKASVPPHRLVTASGEDVEDGLRDGKYVKYGDSLQTSERRMDRKDFVFAEKTATGSRISTLDSTPQSEVMYAEDCSSDDLEKSILEETNKNIKDSISNLERDQSAYGTSVTDRYSADDGSLRMPSDERMRRGI